MVHKVFATNTLCSFRNIVDLFSRVANTTYMAFLVAEPDELREELAWAASRKGSKSFGKDVGTILQEPLPFAAVLTDREDARRLLYQREHPGCVYMLTQEIQSGYGVHGSETVLHTIVATPSLHWVDAASRWYTPTELLASMGFPCTPAMLRSLSLNFGKDPARLSTFCSYNHDLKGGIIRKRADLLHQAGNSMNISVAGMMWVFLLMGVPHQSPTEHDKHLDELILRFASACSR
jgi:hypothetical protein